jgi:hypothetical protein
MREKLKSFLEAKNLDVLQLNKERLGELKEEDTVLIRSILKKREPSLALSNLLFNPSILPSDLQNDAILRGIGDEQNQYIVLAATVGLQELNPQQFSDKEREIVVNSLLNIIKRYQNVLADRASISVLPFLNQGDEGNVITLFSEISGITLHNLLGWLYQTAAHSSYAKLREKIAQEKLPMATRKEIEKKLERDEQGQALGLTSLLALPVSSYIPEQNEM